ncbi:hypothetical protein ISCGN_026281, partial [Ixodes scapularis]
RSGLYDSKAISLGQGRLCEALRLQAGRNHPGDVGLPNRALCLLGPLRALGLAHARHLAWLRPHWHSLRLPPLFAEIFDIPAATPPNAQLLTPNSLLVAGCQRVTGSLLNDDSVRSRWQKSRRLLQAVRRRPPEAPPTVLTPEGVCKQDQ